MSSLDNLPLYLSSSVETISVSSKKLVSHAGGKLFFQFWFHVQFFKNKSSKCNNLTDKL